MAEATRIVAAQGWAGATVAAVAAAAEISTGAVYQHFPNKGALAAEVFRRATQRELEVLGTVLSASEPVSSADRLAQGVGLFAQRAILGRQLAYALIAEPADPLVVTERLNYRRRYHEVFAAVILDGVRAGEMVPQNAAVTAAALTGGVAEVLIGQLSGPVDGPAARSLVAELTALALRCVGVPVTQFAPSALDSVRPTSADGAHSAESSLEAACPSS
ncbi:transcriptional regulator, TetR family [Cryptosporangium aurantiacum]|uniref:Transcriptional regulator, TetR family n=1 Tax=Cryptosporangium aurantiacum TaxID=134849 RepID=A0A1M7QA26_9ACTN|nr:transcriptional regulator, TetR family [Cryptosporangium aurantiacum]